MTDTFDGDAVSRADREFLDSLDNHPLIQHPLYSVPPPPRPDYAGCTTAAERTARQRACFPAALDWMLINYAYYADAFLGKGGIISLVDGKIGTVAAMRGLMQPYAIVEEGPYGGLHKTSVVDAWMSHPLRAHIDKIQTRFDRLRPTFEEEGVIVYNRYWPSVHPVSGGELKSFDAFFARLIPNDTEREWMWNYLAHKARRPWVPMIAVIMVAEEFGTGRGTLFDILELLFGEDYVVPCTFGELTGTAAGAAAAELRGAKEYYRAVTDGAASLRGERTARLRAALGENHDDRNQPPRRDETAGRRSALQRRHLRQQDDAIRTD